MRRAGYIERRAQRRRHRPVCGCSVEPAQHQRAFALGLRHHLQRHFGHDRERAPGSRQQFAEIVAGDVFHHPAAGLEAVAEAGHPVRPQKMIAGAAGLDAARTGEAGADHAADGAEVWHPQQRGSVDRLEGELLIPGIDQRLHVGERGAGLYGDDQLVRLIGRHRIEIRQVEQRIGRHRLADPPLGAMADDFQRLLAGDRRAHHLLDIPGVSYFQGIHVARLARSRHQRGRPAGSHHRHPF